jgi:DNA-3-methyladenine glycosylase II
MQLRTRAATKSVIQITQVLKPKKAVTGIRKVTKRTITTITKTEESHPLEIKKDNAVRHQTPQPSNDPTLATLKSPNSHRFIHIPHSELHATFLQRATDHLVSVDPRFKDLLDKNECHVFSPSGLKEGVDPFKALVCGILSQQVSGAAARSITRKFVLLFSEPDEEGNPPEGFFPTPQQVLTKAPEVLRTAGLSGRKVEYVLDLSARFADGRLTAEDMVHDSDEKIIEKLVEVRGIGLWSISICVCD